jgi:hypothetical protein
MLTAVVIDTILGLTRVPDWVLLVMDTLETAPPVIETLARDSEPLPIPLMAFLTTTKFWSSSDNGMETVALANVLGMVIGSAI